MHTFLGVISFSLVCHAMIQSISGLPLATSYSYRVDGHSGYSQKYGYNRVARSNYGSHPSTNSYAVHIIHEQPLYWEKQNYADPQSYGTPYYRKHFEDIGDFGKYFDGNPISYWENVNGYGVDFENDDYNDYGYNSDQFANVGYPEYGSDDTFDYGGDDYYNWKYV